MNSYLWRKSEQKNTNEENVKSCNRYERKFCTKEKEGLLSLS